MPRILSEGGPRVLAAMYAASVVDELCLALAPVVLGGHEVRVTMGDALSPPTWLRLAHVLVEDDFLFLRYVRDASR
jgi:riboflavin biosynthesis pyrimidine reductase